MSRPAGRPVITLLTDFGTRDPYVACMKGVILGICPEAVIVDITHDIPKFDVRTGPSHSTRRSPTSRTAQSTWLSWTLVWGRRGGG